jgi:transposase
MVSPDSLGTACPLSGRNSTYRLVQILEAGSNITIMALPPKCPELNPVENVWQFLRDNWLSNRVFKSYDDLVDHCCVAWNKLVNQPWRIMSIGLRQWAHRF